MEVVNKNIDELKPFSKNPKIHPQKQIEMLKKSMGEFGYTNPILINKDNMIVAGHARYQAAKEIGLSEVPTIQLDLTYEKAVAYVVADNRLAELAETDDKLISQIIKDTQAALPDFDIEAMGYSETDYEQLLKDVVAHDNKYKPGQVSTMGAVTYTTDENTALSADAAAQEIFAGRSIIVVFYSGGKDSSFSLIWAKRNFPDKQIIAVFSDTGYEFPGMVAHIHRVTKHLEVECKIVHPETDIFSYWEEKGRFFNMIFPECQIRLIYQPINAFLKTFEPNDIVILDGSRGDQVRRLSNKTKTSGSCDKDMGEYTYYHPCYDVDYALEEKVVLESGIPVWEGYSMGFKRSACWCCPGQNGTQAYALSKNFPGFVNVLRKWEKKLNMELNSKGKGIDKLIEIGKKRAEKLAAGQEVEEDEWVSIPKSDEPFDEEKLVDMAARS